MAVNVTEHDIQQMAQIRGRIFDALVFAAATSETNSISNHATLGALLDVLASLIAHATRLEDEKLQAFVDSYAADLYDAILHYRAEPIDDLELEEAA